MKKAVPRLILSGAIVILVTIYVLLRLIPIDVIDYVQSLTIPLFILTLLAGFVFAFFIFVTLLKKRISFLPNLCIIFGIFGYLLSALLFYEGLLSHTLAHTLEEAFLGIVCIAAAFALYKKAAKLRLWLPWAVIAAAGSLILFVCVFLPPAASLAMQPTVVILCIIYFFGMLVSLLITVKTPSDAELLLNPLISCMLTASTVLGSHKTIHLFTSEFIVSFVIIMITLYSGCKEFIILEKKHNELTKNFQKDLERQTSDLRNLLAEREKLLRFLSHDMRKPVVSIRRFLIELIQQEKDPEQIKALHIVDMKVNGIEKSLTELASYSKMTYVAELSRSFPLMDVVDEVYRTLKPDCDANGIRLSVHRADVNVFAKPNTLNSVLTNLVMNAVEHASCTSIDISVIKNADEVSIVVADNGVGLRTETESTIFNAYKTTSDGEAHGLGLYICRSHMESMNGRITCVQGNGLLSFVVVLPTILG